MLRKNFEEVQKLISLHQNYQKLPTQISKLSQLLTKNLNFLNHFLTLRAENITKCRSFKDKKTVETSLTAPKKLWKKQENAFFDIQNCQKLPIKMLKMGQMLTKHFEFWIHLSTFSAENITKNRRFKAEKTLKTSKTIKKNKKDRKWLCLPKIVKTRVASWKKNQISGPIIIYEL